MSPKRIMFIRHAEKPGVGNDDGGVAPVGVVDKESLTVRGWQRAGALVWFFNSRPDMRPRAIFASGIGHQSKSKRPMETVMPLAELLKQTGETAFVTKHLKDDLQPLIEDVLSQEGPVLVSWEHDRIAPLVAKLPNPPAVPGDWPDGRFDMVWVLDRTAAGWSFSQIPQLLLAGDSPDPIT
jgi:broad specificity phosphatase PhoE